MICLQRSNVCVVHVSLLLWNQHCLYRCTMCHTSDDEEIVRQVKLKIVAQKTKSTETTNSRSWVQHFNQLAKHPSSVILMIYISGGLSLGTFSFVDKDLPYKIPREVDSESNRFSLVVSNLSRCCSNVDTIFSNLFILHLEVKNLSFSSQTLYDNSDVLS